MKYYFLFLFFSFYIFSSAQTKSSFSEIRIAPYFTSDFSTFSIGSLNDYLTSKNYYTISNTLSNMSIGVSLRSIYQPSLIAVTFCRSESFMEDPENNSMINSNGIRVDYSYDLIKNEKWLIAPSIAYQFSNYQLMAMSQNAISTLTGNKLEESAQVLSKDLFSAGVLFDRQITIRFVNIHIGIHAFYNLNIGEESWFNSNHQELVNIPAINLSGICIGFNGRIELNPDKIKINR